MILTVFAELSRRNNGFTNTICQLSRILICAIIVEDQVRHRPPPLLHPLLPQPLLPFPVPTVKAII